MLFIASAVTVNAITFEYMGIALQHWRELSSKKTNYFLY